MNGQTHYAGIRLRKEYIDAPYEYQFLVKKDGKEEYVEVPLPMRLDENMQPVWPFEHIMEQP